MERLPGPVGGSPGCYAGERYVMTPPRFDQHSGLGEAVEDFAVEEFVAQRPVEALVIAVLPWRPRRNIEGRDADLSEPFLDRRRDKFAAIGVTSSFVR